MAWLLLCPPGQEAKAKLGTSGLSSNTQPWAHFSAKLAAVGCKRWGLCSPWICPSLTLELFFLAFSFSSLHQRCLPFSPLTQTEPNLWFTINNVLKTKLEMKIPEIFSPPPFHPLPTFLIFSPFFLIILKQGLSVCLWLAWDL